MKQQFPNLVSAYQIAEGAYNGCAVQVKEGVYCPARPIGWPSFRSRVRLAWLVFTGQADALVWPGQGYREGS